eukprot:TRINITY_DN612_c0_g3_i5.p2 TRINITY_DN612_c0_g3~~TRINITY_DN612_c0_g3_i5.p2  ORF type:complete len:122 (+),score=1.93 TRINITY_DN612_c0_g3_i5:673-1038(+)
MPSMKRLFQHRSQFKAAAFPKMHDPVHEPEIINAVESLANINEMNIGEKENKVLHEEVTRTPGRNVEPTLLQRVHSSTCDVCLNPPGPPTHPRLKRHRDGHVSGALLSQIFEDTTLATALL